MQSISSAITTSVLRHIGQLNSTSAPHIQHDINAISNTSDNLSKLCKSITIENLYRGNWIYDIHDIHDLGKSGDFRQFTHDDFPNKLLKFSSTDEKTIEYFKKYKSLIEDVKSQELDQVIVPDAELMKITFSDGEHYLIVEDKLAIEEDATTHLMLYSKYSKELKVAVKQIAALIFQAGINDIDSLNFKVILDSETKQPKLALVQLEKHDIKPSKPHDFFYYTMYHLIKYFPESANDIAAEARKHLAPAQLYNTKVIVQPLINQAEEIVERNNDIAAFHQRSNVTKESPAIPDHVAQIIYKSAADKNPTEKTPTQEELKEIVLIINLEVARNKDNHSQIMAREYLLTQSRNPSSPIYQYYDYIQDTLAPLLLNNNCLHSISTPEQADKFNFKSTRGLYPGPFYCVLQF